MLKKAGLEQLQLSRGLLTSMGWDQAGIGRFNWLIEPKQMKQLPLWSSAGADGASPTGAAGS